MRGILQVLMLAAEMDWWIDGNFGDAAIIEQHVRCGGGTSLGRGVDGCGETKEARRTASPNHRHQACHLAATPLY
jgi:hypothetical protein